MQPRDVATLDVLRVDRAEIPAGSAAGDWPCASCGRGYSVHDGWLVDYYHHPTREAARAYICPRCAQRARARLPHRSVRR